MRRSSFLAKIPFCQTSFGTEAAFLLSAIIVLPLSSSVPIKKPFSLAKLYAYVPSLTFQMTFFEVMFLPISVTLAGIVISVIAVLLKTLSPICSWAAHFFENPDKDTKLTEQKPIQENDKRDCRNTTDNQVKNQTDKITEEIYYRREEPSRTVAKIRPFELTLVVRAERKRCVDVYR